MLAGAISELANWAAAHPFPAAAVILFFLLLMAASGEIEEEQGKNYTRAHLVNASPRTFEELTAQAFEKQGYDAEVLPEGPDNGVDVIAKNRKETVGVQSKRYQVGNKVGGPTVRRVAGAAQQHGVDRAAIATSSGFTQPAEEAAESLDITLIDGEELADELSD